MTSLETNLPYPLATWELFAKLTSLSCNTRCFCGCEKKSTQSPETPREIFLWSSLRLDNLSTGRKTSSPHKRFPGFAQEKLAVFFNKHFTLHFCWAFPVPKKAHLFPLLWETFYPKESDRMRNRGNLSTFLLSHCLSTKYITNCRNYIKNLCHLSDIWLLVSSTTLAEWTVPPCMCILAKNTETQCSAS